MKRILLLLLIVLFMANCTTIEPILAETGLKPKFTNSYTFHEPIYIDDNSDFGPSGYDFPGYGNCTHPYIIEGYNITSWSESPIDIRYTSVNFTIRNCWLDGINQTINFVLAITNTQDFVITDNVIKNGKTGIGVFGSSNVLITNNKISNLIFYGIHVLDSSEVIIKSNTIFSVGTNGINLYAAAYTIEFILVENNRISDCRNGIHHGDKTYNCTIRNNDIYDCEIGLGLTIGPILDNNYVNNNLHDNDYGIWFGSGTGAEIQDNIIYNNTVTENLMGIRINEKVYFNDFINNTISDNEEGIYLVGGVNNIISYNTIQNNSQYGVKCRDVTELNNFTHNNFLNNPIEQAIDDGHINLFINNYWSNWVAPDTNPFDGIVDNPYEITGSADNQDIYPLASPIIIKHEPFTPLIPTFDPCNTAPLSTTNPATSSLPSSQPTFGFTILIVTSSITILIYDRRRK